MLETCRRLTGVEDASRTPHLLVADDSTVDRNIVSHILSRAGYRVTACADGREAVTHARRDLPDLVILDLEMPVLDGVGVCRELKSLAAFESVPILVVSAHEELGKRVEVFEAGALDFIRKPFEPLDVLARVRAHLRVGQLTRLLSEAYQGLEARSRQLDEDLVAAGEIQRSLLPKRALSTARLRTAWRFQPCDRVGGDLFQFHRLDEGHVGAYVLDVEGHGVPAAMVSTSLSRSLDPRGGVTKRIVATEQGERHQIVSPGEVIAALDREYPIERFGRHFTLCYCVLDLTRGTLCYSGAGHPHPLLQRRSGPIVPLQVGGPIVGLDLGAVFPEEVLQLRRGDRIFLFTDGVYEFEDASGVPFGVDRIRGIVAEAAQETLDRVCERLVQAALDYRGAARAQDDLTVVGLEFTGEDAGPGAAQVGS